MLWLFRFRFYHQKTDISLVHAVGWPLLVSSGKARHQFVKLLSGPCRFLLFTDKQVHLVSPCCGPARSCFSKTWQTMVFNLVSGTLLCLLSPKKETNRKPWSLRLLVAVLIQ